MTPDKPSVHRGSVIPRRIKAVDKERWKNRVRIDILRMLIVVSSHAYSSSEDEVQQSSTGSLTDNTKAITDHLVGPTAADSAVFGRTRLVVLDGTAHKPASSTLLSLITKSSSLRYRKPRGINQSLVSEVQQVWSSLKNTEASRECPYSLTAKPAPRCVISQIAHAKKVTWIPTINRCLGPRNLTSKSPFQASEGRTRARKNCVNRNLRRRYKDQHSLPHFKSQSFTSDSSDVAVVLQSRIFEISRTPSLEPANRTYLLRLQTRYLSLDTEQKVVSSRDESRSYIREPASLPENRSGKSSPFSPRESQTGPAVHITDHFSYSQSLRQTPSASSRAQSTSAINEQLASFRRALRPTSKAVTPSRLENRQHLLQSTSLSPLSASTSNQPYPQLGVVAPDSVPDSVPGSAVGQKQSQYIASLVELAVPQELRLLRTIRTSHQPISPDKQLRDPHSDNSDYSESRPSSEEIRIAQGSYIANQNSAYYAQLYTVGNPFTQSPQKTPASIVRGSDHSLAGSIQPLPGREALPGAYSPPFLSPFDSAPIERRREWKHTERRLTGPGFVYSEVSTLPDDCASTGVDSSPKAVDDNPCHPSFNTAYTSDHFCDHRTQLSPHITADLESSFGISNKIHISTPSEPTSRPASLYCRAQRRRNTDSEHISSADLPYSQGFCTEYIAKAEIQGHQPAEVQLQVETLQTGLSNPHQPLFCQDLEDSPTECSEYLNGLKVDDTKNKYPLEAAPTPTIVKRPSGDEPKNLLELTSIKPRSSSEPFLGREYQAPATEKNQQSSFAASDKTVLERYDSANKGAFPKSAFTVNVKSDSPEPKNSGSTYEHLAQSPNLSPGDILKRVPRLKNPLPVPRRCNSDPPHDVKQNLSAHALKKEKAFAKLKEWKSLLTWKQADDNRGEKYPEDDRETISEKDSHRDTRPPGNQSQFLGNTIAPEKSDKGSEFATTTRKQDTRQNRSSYLPIENLGSPPIPAKSPARLILLGRENAAHQNQTLAHCGGRFDSTPSTPYPIEVDDITVLCVLQAYKTSIDFSAIGNSGLLPFSDKLSATETCSSSTHLSTGLDSIGVLSQVALSSLPSTPPASAFSSNEQASVTSSNDHIASATTLTPRLSMENNLQIRPAEFSSVKTKAVEDAKQMLATVIEAANKSGQDPPKYALLELIGKGSFGRVYKGKDMISAAIVAVKIIDIDESDTVNPRIADSYSDFLKEVNALKILSENKARNINHVIEALPVGQSMWMISEYCGGGSIATLMKPNAPGGLQEKWIIPILREVAEAVKWVHQAGIIHRDIKCANVLITEEGGVQLCDFGVAGIIETKLDKRSTMIGTPHWMAPELFGPTPSYGKEVDIWAFGSMVFEIATGYPPNAVNRIPFERLGTHLKHNAPRLEGGNYSNELRDLVAYCLEELPSVRPTIEQVQQHPYIHNTTSRYPASTLSHLVRAFKLWEDHGGSRKSLFMLGGAQGPSESSSAIYDDEWNFSTTAAFDQEVSRDSNPQDVYEAYGNTVLGFSEETSRPIQQSKPSRRRPPPEALARLPAPLEKIFDPNTLSNYDENSRNHYGRVMPLPTSDLPLRDDSAQTSIRDTMIDLGGHDSETGISNFPDMDTIKADRRGPRDEIEDEYGPLHDFSRPALSDPADINPNRRTQDWKFPTMAPPASADPEISRFPTSYELQRPAVTPGSGSRPALVHHPTEPLSGFGGMLGNTTSAMDRMSVRESLIDLDMSLPDVIPDLARPSTANSDVGSTASNAGEYTTSGNPFEFEKHASMYLPPAPFEPAGPSNYASEGTSAGFQPGGPLQQIVDMSDFSASDVEPSTRNMQSENIRYDGGSDSDYLSMAPPPTHGRVPGATVTEPAKNSANTIYSMNRFPELPPPPSAAALSGLVSRDDMRAEILRQLTGMTDQLSAFKDVYESPMVVNRAGQPRRTGRAGDGNGGGQ